MRPEEAYALDREQVDLAAERLSVINGKYGKSRELEQALAPQDTRRARPHHRHNEMEGTVSGKPSESERNVRLRDPAASAEMRHGLVCSYKDFLQQARRACDSRSCPQSRLSSPDRG
jgi:hypothetical protein